MIHRDCQRKFVRQALIIWFILMMLAVTGCGSKKKEVLKSNDDLYKSARESIERGKMRGALTLLKNVGVSEEVSKDQAPLILLATADANFYLEDLMSIAEAAKSYTEFITFYSDHTMADYAQFQIGMCYYNLTNTPENDQEQTFKAIEEFKKVKIMRSDSPFLRAAEGMIRKCQDKIAEHEFLIGQFYYKKKSYGAAAERLRGILNSYVLYQEKEKVYFYLGESLLKMENFSEGKIYLDKILVDYPKSKYARYASEALGSIK